MIEIYSLTNEYPDLEYHFKSVEGHLKITVKKGAAKQSYTASPYTRSEIIMMNLHTISKNVQAGYDKITKERNK